MANKTPDPTQEEIRQACLQIRASWPDGRQPEQGRSRTQRTADEPRIREYWASDMSVRVYEEEAVLC